MSENLQQQLNQLPSLLGSHLNLTLIALAIGIAISLPTAILVSRLKLLRWSVLTGAGVIQTIPSLALLALMVALTGGFGFVPALVALSLYSILPILRNTVTGIVGVDPALTEAARGMGMTRAQTLRRVELPLAMPVILAGLRTATVWVVGTATLSTPVGQPSLGNYIFAGLQTRNWTAVLVGAISAAMLAVLLDFQIGQLEIAAARRSRPRAWVAGGSLVAVFACGLLAPVVQAMVESSRQSIAATQPSSAGTTQAAADGPSAHRAIRIGSKTFTEQYILASALEQTLQRQGIRAQRIESLGSTVAFDALRSGQIDVYVDYSGTVWANYLKRKGSTVPWRMLDIVTGELADQWNVRCLGALGFENAYALAMPRKRADELGVRTIQDLAARVHPLRIGGDYEFFDRPEWRDLRDAYHLGEASPVNFDSSFMYQAARDGEVDAISAFSSDGRIAAFDLAVLADPKHVLPPYDAIVLLSPEAAEDQALVIALMPLIGAIDGDAMREANKAVDVDRRTPAEVGRELADRVLDRKSK